MRHSFVKTWRRESIVESTSDLAREIATREEVDLPLVVTARRQTRGRGRGDRSWWSDSGSLLFTIVIDPAAHGLEPRHEPRVALATAVAIVEAVTPRIRAAKAVIRWPNDIEAEGRKLGGILPELFETPRGRRLAIGVGLNVLTALDGAPPEIRRMAVSLADLATLPRGYEEIGHLLDEILVSLESAIARLVQDDPALAMEWDQLDTLRGCHVRVDLGPRIVEGVGQGIDAEGALLLADERGVTPIHGGRVLREAGATPL